MFKLLSRQGCNSAVKQILFCEKFEVRKATVYYFYSSAGSARFASTGVSDVGKTVPLIENIPEPPSVPDPSALGLGEAVQNLAAANGGPTFASLGLGGWGPVGVVQNAFEYLHVTLDVPWWGAILIGTLVVRIAMFPLVIISQRNSTAMNVYLSAIQTLQSKKTQACQSAIQLDSARSVPEMMLFRKGKGLDPLFMKEKGLNPLKDKIIVLAQASVFVSLFMGLQGMAKCPVESMTHGGLWWFTDLTVPDQYFILPLVTSATLWANIELGVDRGRLEAHNLQAMRYFLWAIPVLMIPVTIKFPGAILVYWCSSNFLSLFQLSFLKIPAVREYFKIPKMITHTPDNLPIKKKGFVDCAKESWNNINIVKVAIKLAVRQRTDKTIFTKAGKGPIQKTFKFDPTKLSNVQEKSK